MNPDHHYRERVAPVGSSLHYSLLSVSESTRRAVIALRALAQALLEIPVDGDQTLPAMAKIGWWRDELDRMFAGQARHPITQALAPHAAVDEQTQALVADLIEAGRRQLEHPFWPDNATFEEYQRLAVDGLTHLQVALGTGQNAPASNTLLQLGRFADLVVRIRDIGRHARQGRVHFPLPDLDQHGVKPEDLCASEPSTAVKSFLAHQSESALTCYHDATAKLDAGELKAARLPVLTLAKLRMYLLQEMSASNFRILDRRMELTALRKLWIAIRTR